MSVFLDTSVIIRHLTGDHIELSDRATQIIEEVDDLMVTEGVLGETVFVLLSVYELPRLQVTDSVITLVRRDNISTYAFDKSLVLQGLEMCRRSGRISIGDALIWAAARTDGASAIYTFDRRFPGEGIELRQSA